MRAKAFYQRFTRSYIFKFLDPHKTIKKQNPVQVDEVKQLVRNSYSVRNAHWKQSLAIAHEKILIFRAKIPGRLGNT
jgi:hypothetical protein